MKTLWILTFITTSFAVVKSDAQDLHINIAPRHGIYYPEDHVNIVINYTNVGSETLRLYKWNCPERELNDPLFMVSFHGESVDYVGRLIKRGEPKEEDLIDLEPRSTLSCLIDLSLVYDMSETGDYTIQFQRWPEQLLSTEENDDEDSIPSWNIPDNIILVSPRIVVFVVGRPNELINEANEANSLFRELTPTLVNCKDFELTPLMDALKTAEEYANNAVEYFDTEDTATLRYTTWFGKYTASNWDVLTGDYSRIQAAIVGQTLTFDCLCGVDNAEDTFAYVYPQEAYTIYLCGAFWRAPVSGSNSKAGTIIHELSHFKVVAGTGDVTYGEDSAKNLAKKNPRKAITNADNIEYFAENTPPLQ